MKPPRLEQLLTQAVPVPLFFFELVHPCDVGVGHDEHRERLLGYQKRGQRYSGIRWADGLEGFVIWPAHEPAPSVAWLAHARWWAEEQASPDWRQLGLVH